MSIKINNEILSDIAGKTIELDESAIQSLNSALEEFKITTKNRMAHFLSQCCHESGGFRWFTELASGQDYENRKDLGNFMQGDGPKYRGAGAIQITGRYNYQKFCNFIKDPRVMEGHYYVSKKYPFQSSGFWWMLNKMNEDCDKNVSCADISKIVNGANPARGLAQREKYYSRALAVLAKVFSSHQQEAAPIMEKPSYRITAIKNTALKKRLVQSSSLMPTEIVTVGPGHVYNAETVSELEGTGHSVVKLAYGSGEWFIYNPHWKIEELSGAVKKAQTAAVSVYRTAVRAMNISQPNSSTCQAACIGIALSNSDVMGIRRELDKIASQIGGGRVAASVDVMGKYIRSKIGNRYEFDIDASLDEMKNWLKAGELLITHGWFTNSGHVICLDGVAVDNTNMSFKFDVKDPWSEFNAPAWAYNINSNFYDGYYSANCIYSACVLSHSRADAARIYKQNRIDPLRKGAWVHRIKAK
jgi:predicted chitinase